MKKTKMYHVKKDVNGCFFIRKLKYKKQRIALFIFLIGCAVCAILTLIYTIGVYHGFNS